MSASNVYIRIQLVIADTFKTSLTRAQTALIIVRVTV